MIITLPVPDNVAREYFVAAEKLTTHLAPIGAAPDARTLMVMVLASIDAEELVAQFDLALRSIIDTPIPPKDWDVPPDFRN